MLDPLFPLSLAGCPDPQQSGGEADYDFDLDSTPWGGGARRISVSFATNEINSLT